MCFSFQRANITLAVITLAGGSANAQHGSDGPAAGPPKTYGFRYEVTERKVTVKATVDLKLPRKGASGELKQTVKIPGRTDPIRLLRFLPQAAREQTVEVDTEGASPPAIHLSVNGPERSETAWLLAGVPQRNRFTSTIADWRYVAVETKEQRDKLYEHFKIEQDQPAVIIISAPNSPDHVTIPARSGEERDVPGLGCTVRVKAFLPHFSMDKDNNRPFSVSDRRVNPAALVEIEREGDSTERWVFTRFPDFGADETSKIPVRVELSCPIEPEDPAPSFLIVTVGGDKHELWTRANGKYVARPFAAEEKIPVPGTSHVFQMARFVASAKLIEHFKPTTSNDSMPALEIEWVGTSGRPDKAWIGLDQPLHLETESGPIRVELVSTAPRKPGHDNPHGAP